MKFKRLLLGVGLSVVMMVSSLILVYAASDSDYATPTNASVKLYGYVDFDEFVTCGQLYYNASLSGVDASNVAETDKNVYIQPSTNKRTYDKIYLHKGKKTVSETKLVSTFATSGRLELKCYDASKSLYATD